MSNGDLSHLFDDDKPVAVKEPPHTGKKAGRPTREQAAEKLALRMKEPAPHYTVFRKPVGITFLASVLGKQPRQIQKRLEKCPVETWSRQGSKEHPMYDFLTAMGYLVPPKGDIEDWFAQQNAASLPPYVNKMFWDSAHQRNRVMLSSNDLWHTEDVMLVLGRVEITIRNSVKMWIENLPEKELLTNDQYNSLVDSVNLMVDDLRKVLVETPGKTLSMTDHIKSELDASGKIPDDADRASEDDE